MIHMNYESKEGRRIAYSVAFTLGRIINEIENLGIDQAFMDPLFSKVMEQLGDRGVFGTDRGRYGG